MPTDFPVSLSADTVGALSLALPFIAVFIIGIIKGSFYHFAPNKWQVALPDKFVWPVLAGIICIISSFLLKINIGDRIFGNDWPASIPLWLNYIASGIILTALSTKAIYPLMVEPAEKAKSKIDAQAAIAKAKAMETKIEPATEWPTPPPVDDVMAPTGDTTYNNDSGIYKPIVEEQAEETRLPLDVNISESVESETQKNEATFYRTSLLTLWKPGLIPTHVLIERSDRTQKVIELSKYKEVKD